MNWVLRDYSWFSRKKYVPGSIEDKEAVPDPFYQHSDEDKIKLLNYFWENNNGIFDVVKGPTREEWIDWLGFASGL